jgi:hypothetical protein
VGSAPGGLKLGLRRVDETQWFQREFDRAARAAAFAADPDAVCVLPQAEPAVAELAALLGAENSLRACAQSCWEDLCLLLAPGEGPPVFVAGAVGFPTDWRLRDKIGLPLTAVHAPIHGYAERLSGGVDHFMANLVAGPIFGRANWFVVPTDAWPYRPESDPAARFAHVRADNAGETLFVRCERQTLRRLPQSSAILFTIGVHVARLGSLPGDVVRGIARAVSKVLPGEDERRAAPHYADALAAYACALPAAAAWNAP